MTLVVVEAERAPARVKRTSTLSRQSASSLACGHHWSPRWSGPAHLATLGLQQGFAQHQQCAEFGEKQWTVATVKSGAEVVPFLPVYRAEVGGGALAIRSWNLRRIAPQTTYSALLGVSIKCPLTAQTSMGHG